MHISHTHTHAIDTSLTCDDAAQIQCDPAGFASEWEQCCAKYASFVVVTPSLQGRLCLYDGLYRAYNLCIVLYCVVLCCVVLCCVVLCCVVLGWCEGGWEGGWGGGWVAVLLLCGDASGDERTAFALLLQSLTSHSRACST